LKNLSQALRSSEFEFVNHDVIEPFQFDVDGIFNLACPASPINYQRNPVETIRTSFLGALNSLELARSSNSVILQASTSEVYGDPMITPQPEDYWGNVNPIGIRSCYDEGKRAAETLFFDFHREYDTKIKVARIFNTYGPRMDLNDGRVVSNFVKQALNGSPITIYGKGTQTRSFCFVSDLIDGLVRLFFSKESVTGPVNLGNPKETTMLELAELVLILTESKSEIIYQELPLDDPKQRNPTIFRARELLEWSPTTDLETGLLKMITDFRSRIDA
jgi:UDP-glucuronate decarboxylase